MPVETSEARRLWGLVGLFAVVSGIARALPMPGAPLWFDETYSLRVIDPANPGSLWSKVEATESTPPLFYALSSIVRALGVDGVASIRLVPLLAVSAAVLVAYWATRSFFAPRVAAVAAGLVAVHPMVSTYAIDGRSYGVLLLIAFGLTGTLGRALSEPTARRLAAWAVLATLALYTHYFAGFLVATGTLVLLVLRPDARRAILGATAGWVLACLPLSVLVTAQGGDQRAGFIGERSLWYRTETAARELFGSLPNVANGVEAVTLVLAVGAVVFAVLPALRALRARGARPAPPAELVLLALVVVTAVVPLALSLVSEQLDRVLGRNLIVVLPALVMLMALGVTRLRRTAVPLAALAACLSLGSALVLYDWKHGQSDVPGMIDRVGPGIRTDALLTNEPREVIPYLLQRTLSPPGTGVTVDRIELLLGPKRDTTRTWQLAPIPETLGRLRALGFVIEQETVFHAVRRLSLRAPAPVVIAPGVLAPLDLYLPAPLLDPGRQRALLGPEWG